MTVVILPLQLAGRQTSRSLIEGTRFCVCQKTFYSNPISYPFRPLYPGLSPGKDNL